MPSAPIASSSYPTFVSPWVDFGHHGSRRYRVWQRRISSNLVEQRHEWERDDGSFRLDRWIRGASIIGSHMVQIDEVAA